MVRSRLRSTVGAVILVASAPGSVAAQPCQQLSDVYAAVLGGTTGGASADSGNCGGGGAPESEVVFFAPRAGTYRIDTIGSSFDTVLYVRSAAEVELACNDDLAPDTRASRVDVALAAGEMVIVTVDGFASDQGAFVLRINGNCPQLGHDDPRDLGSPSSITVGGSTTCGTFAAAGASCGDGGDNAPDATFLYTAPAAGAYAVTATGLDFAPLLSLRSASCNGAELACATGGDSPAAMVALAAGQTIVVAVDASGGTSGDFSLTIQRLPTPTPTVTVTRTATATRTVTATRTLTATRSRTATATNSRTPRPSRTRTPTRTATASRTPTRTSSATPSATPSITATPTQTPTASPPPTPTATSSTVIIDFEILAAAGPGEPAAVLAADQYADVGVTFNAPAGLDYDRGLTIPGFAHSGSKAVEPCYGAEFCTTPVAMTFAEPQQRVKLWVGSRRRLDAPREVVLLAFDAAGAEVARASGTLDASSGPIPIRLPLEVTAASPLIASAAVRYGSPSALTGGLAVDDVEFDAAGMASCPSPRDPIVSLGPQPSEVQTNQLLLSGSIGTLAPLESVTVEVTGSGGGHELDLLASGAIHRAGGDFGPLRLTGLLFPGSNLVAIVARDCHGRRSSTFAVTYTPFAPDTRIELQHIEVTQSVQDDRNSVPLIADKRTLARVFLRTSDGRAIANVRATLTACHQLAEGLPICDESLPSIYARAPITIDGASDLAAERLDPDRSLDFELPADWVQTGGLHLSLASLEIDGLPAEVPCDRCDNPNPFGFPGFHQFHMTKPLSFLLIQVKYREGGVTYLPRPTDVAHLRSWLRRAYPTSRVTAPAITMRLTVSGVPTRNEVLSRLSFLKLANRVYNGLVGWWHGGVKPTGISYAFIYDGGVVNGVDGPYFVRGLACDDAGVGVGPTGDPGVGTNYSWDTDGTYGDWYGGHELGHLHGRLHPGFIDDSGQCVAGTQDDSDVDGGFPYAGGSAGQPGWDAGDASLGIAARLLRPFSSTATGGATDMMTYCQNEWISDYTYRAILHRLDPSAALVAGDTEPELAADGLVVTGTINLTRDTAALDYFVRLADAPMDAHPASGAYAVDLRDDDGALLASYPFAPEVGSDAPLDEDLMALLSVVVPFDPATHTIEISHDGQVIGGRVVSATAPTVELLSPNGGETLPGATAPVSWQADDADGDPLSFTLLYSTDGGDTWVPIATDLDGDSAAIDLDDLPGSSAARLRILASDGVNTAIDDSDGVFSVPPRAPVVRITAPAVDGPLSSRQTVMFAGEAFDAEDGELTGDALRWRSDRQGALGSGESVAVAGLQPGHHLVTLEAEDSDGLRAAATLELDVVAELPQALVLAPRITAAGADVDLTAGGAAAGGEVSWRWAVASRPADSDGHLLATDGAATLLTTDVVGIYVVELVARDAQGNVAVTRFTITAVARGDCNADGIVDAADRFAIVSEIFADDAEQCDANGDGRVTAADLIPPP